MGKKKHKLRKHQKDPGSCESSEEDDLLDSSGKSQCSHIIRAVNISSVKKIFKTNITLGECQTCASSNSTKDHTNDCETVVWLCLQCGNQGCDRNSPGQHALQHYQTPRSDSHAVALNLISWSVWCYDCDEEVMPDWSKKLLECIEYLKRHNKSTNSQPTSVNSCPDSGEQVSDLLSPGNAAGEKLVLSSTKEGSKPVTIEDKAKSPEKCCPGHHDISEKKKLSDNTILESLPKVKGLTNLGNTCFFNAVMQSLSQTHVLSQLLDLLSTKASTVKLEKAELELVNGELGTANKIQLDPINITLAEGGPLTQSLSLLLKDMQSMGRMRTTSPGQLFGQVCKRAPQFRGAMQQDSHELLRHLIDGLKSEEIKRCQAGILKAFGLSEKVNPKTVDEETAGKVKAYGKLVQQTLVDQIFSGQLISTVLCEECRMSSQVFEPFLDLSLQVAEEKTVRPGLVKRVLAEPSVGCFGKAEDKQPSRYQEKKAKKAAKREAKVQRNKLKQSKKQPLNTSRDPSDEDGKVPEDPEINENSNNESESKSNSIDKEASEPSDADVEDNMESGSTSSMSNNGGPPPAIVGGKDIDNWPSGPILSTCDSMEAEERVCDGMDELYQKVRDVRIREEVLVGENILGSMDDGKVVETEWTSCNGSHDRGSGEEKCDHEKEKQNGFLEDDEKVPVRKQQSVAKLEWMTKSLTTLALRYQPASQECSIHSCLNQFTAPELLTGQNKFGCENCTRIKQKKNGCEVSSKEAKAQTVYTNASKQLLIFNPPAILTLHLKRFQQVGSSLRKVNRHVDFPLTLDLAPFCSSICLGLPTLKKYQTQVLYSLYAVVEHSGRLTGGHYTAYIKVRPPNANLQAFLNMRPASHYDINKLVDEMHSKLYNGATNGDGHIHGDEPANCENIPSRWYHVSDSHVSETSESSVLKCQAYLLFYERFV